jgi:hypothetical protein
MSVPKDIDAAIGRTAALRLALSRLPRRPFAANDYEQGVYRRSPRDALASRHLQLNVPGSIGVLLFDVDHECAAFVWEQVGLPEPSWIAINPKNGHAHYAYVLNRPVLRIDERHQRSVQHALAVQAVIRQRLGADSAYNALLTKNPLSPGWRVLGGGATYDLSDLMEWIPDAEYRAVRGALFSRPAEREDSHPAYGISRKVTLFQDARHFAYEHWQVVVTESRANGTSRTLLEFANKRNVGVAGKPPIAPSMVERIAASITRWLVKRFDPEAAARALSLRQQVRGRRSAAARRRRREDSIAFVLAEIGREGTRATKAEVARRVGCSRESVSRYYSHMFNEPA